MAIGRLRKGDKMRSKDRTEIEDELTVREKVIRIADLIIVPGGATRTLAEIDVESSRRYEWHDIRGRAEYAMLSVLDTAKLGLWAIASYKIYESVQNMF